MTENISATDKITETPWHTLPPDNVIKRLDTDIVTGQSRTEMEKRHRC